MITNNITLAYLCNDLQNAKDYKIDGNKCFHKDEFIGEINEKLNDNVLDIYFKPVKPVNYININFNIIDF